MCVLDAFFESTVGQAFMQRYGYEKADGDDNRSFNCTNNTITSMEANPRGAAIGMPAEDIGAQVQSSELRMGYHEDQLQLIKSIETHMEQIQSTESQLSIQRIDRDLAVIQFMKARLPSRYHSSERTRTECTDL